MDSVPHICTCHAVINTCCCCVELHDRQLHKQRVDRVYFITVRRVRNCSITAASSWLGCLDVSILDRFRWREKLREERREERRGDSGESVKRTQMTRFEQF